MIKGLDEGLLTMSSGGVRRLYIPGDMAFPKGLPSGGWLLGGCWVQAGGCWMCRASMRSVGLPSGQGSACSGADCSARPPACPARSGGAAARGARQPCGV